MIKPVTIGSELIPVQLNKSEQNFSNVLPANIPGPRLTFLKLDSKILSLEGKEVLYNNYSLLTSQQAPSDTKLKATFGDQTKYPKEPSIEAAENMELINTLPPEEKKLILGIDRSKNPREEFTRIHSILVTKETALYNSINGKPSNEQLIKRHDLQTTFNVLSNLAEFYGITEQDIIKIYGRELILKNPGLNEEVKMLVKGKDKNAILLLLNDMTSSDPMDLKQVMKKEFVSSMLIYSFFPEMNGSQLCAEILKATCTGKVDEELLQMTCSLLSKSENGHASDTALDEFSAKLTKVINAAQASKIKSLRSSAIWLCSILKDYGIFDETAFNRNYLKIMWPNLKTSEATLLLAYYSSKEDNHAIAKKLKNVPFATASKDFKCALDYLLINSEDGETNKLISNIEKLEMDREAYVNLLKQIIIVVKKGDNNKAVKMWEEARKISEGSEKLRPIVLEGIHNHDKKFSESFFDKSELNTNNINYNRNRSVARSTLELSRGILSQLVGSLKKGEKLHLRDLRDMVRGLVIDGNNCSKYSFQGMENIGWDLHYRLKEAKEILTEKRIKYIQKYSKKYGVDPKLVAAVILSEQRDQSKAEDVTDFVGGIFGFNTSVGLGQIKVVTARELFPDEFRNVPDAYVTIKLSEDEFNIQAIAKYLDILNKEGKATLKRDPNVSEMGSRYTSSTFSSASHWGHFVRNCYFEIKVMGLSAGSPDLSNLNGFINTALDQD